MKTSVCVLLLTCATGFSAPPEVTREVVGKAGEPVFFEARGDAAKVAFAPGFDRIKCPIVRLYSDDPSVMQFMAFPKSDGEYYVTFWTTGEKAYSQCVLKIGKGAEPVPPKPDPVPPVDTYTAPVYVFIVEETAQRTPETSRLITDVKYWNDLETKGYKMRPYDKDSADAKRMNLDTVKDNTGKSVPLPYMVVADNVGKVINVYPLPTDTARLTALLPKVKVQQKIVVEPVSTVAPVYTLPEGCYMLPNGQMVCPQVPRGRFIR